MLRLLAIVSLLFFATTVAAQNLNSFVTGLPIDAQRTSLSIEWNVEEITDGSVPDVIVEDIRESPRTNGLPDGRIAVLDNDQDILEAWYTEPTERYRHAVLGDGIEAGALKVRTTRSETFTFRLPRTEVFEDITPRIADLDDDGTNEVITILASRDQGASVAVFGLVGNAFIKKAQSPFIGTANRWLNIAGINRFTGRNGMEIVVIETPHLAGLFKVYPFSRGNDRLRAGTAIPGFSNHEIGSRELRLSAMAFINSDARPDLLIPSLDRRTLYGVSIAGGAFDLLTKIVLPARIDKAIKTDGEAGSLEITVGLDDGKIYRIKQN